MLALNRSTCTPEKKKGYKVIGLLQQLNAFFLSVLGSCLLLHIALVVTCYQYCLFFFEKVISSIYLCCSLNRPLFQIKNTDKDVRPIPQLFMVLVLRKFKITIITIQDTPKMKLSLTEKRKRSSKLNHILINHKQPQNISEAPISKF